MALKTLPVGTAYAVWVGIGALGDALFGTIFLGERVSAARVDRKSVVEGKSVSVRVELGGRRIIKTKISQNKIHIYEDIDYIRLLLSQHISLALITISQT